MPITEETVPFHLDPHQFLRTEERLQGGRIPKAGATDVADHAAGGPGQTGFGPRAIEDIQILIVVGAGGRVHSTLELHLVTALQGSYSLCLFEG